MSNNYSYFFPALQQLIGKINVENINQVKSQPLQYIQEHVLHLLYEDKIFWLQFFHKYFFPLHLTIFIQSLKSCWCC